MDKGEIKFTNNPELIEASNNNSIKVLSKDNIIHIHNVMLKKYGGSDGIRDEGLLESVCVAPYQSVFGQDLYPTIYDKAAKLLFDFANYQIFIDGNKRTGMYSSLLFLKANGYNLTLSNEELYDLAMKVANNKIKVEDISKAYEKSAMRIIYEQDKSMIYDKDINKIEQENDGYGR